MLGHKTIRQLLRLKSVEGRLGVEIEVEGTRLPTDLKPEYWRVDSDGSLRGESYEYVMPVPTSLDGVEKSLNYLKDEYKRNRSIINDSIRTGVHVHCNVQDMTRTQLFTFITIYLILENVLVHWCGDSREGNHFCLRTKDAEYLIFTLEEAIRTKNLKLLRTENIRYGSLNCLSLFKYGSIEFRAMRGTSNLNDIYTWAATIEDIYNSSFKFKNPKDVVTSMSGDGEFPFLKKVLKTTWRNYTSIKNFDTAIREATRRIQMLAFTIDWDEYENPNKNPFIDELAVVAEEEFSPVNELPILDEGWDEPDEQ